MLNEIVGRIRQDCLAEFDNICRDSSLRFPGLLIRIEEMSSEAFPLRVFLTFSRNADKEGREVAISVEARVSDGKMLIEFDAAYDDGELLSSGSSVAVSVDDLLGGAREKSLFLHEFDRFLLATKDDIEAAVSQL